DRRRTRARRVLTAMGRGLTPGGQKQRVPALSPRDAPASCAEASPLPMSVTPSLTSLRAFATVGQCLSFTEGAHRLGVTQSAVSRQIRHLESTLDIALFRRIGNAVELTEAGAVLHERLADAFDLIDEAVIEARATLPRQKLTLLAPPTFASSWLSRRLVSFRQRFPDLDLSLHLSPD